MENRPSALLLSLCGLCLALPSCSNRDPNLAGTYALDQERFAEEAFDFVSKLRPIPLGAEEAARNLLRRTRMDLVLKKNGSFQCTMGLPGRTKRYRGTWQSSGSTIELTQTHENDVERSDKMKGRISAAELQLVHREQGQSLPYVLNRKAVTPASPR